MGKSIDVMDCFIGVLLDNKQLNVGLIDLAWENSIDGSVTFGTHCVCVWHTWQISMFNHVVY